MTSGIPGGMKEVAEKFPGRRAGWGPETDHGATEAPTKEVTTLTGLRGEQRGVSALDWA